MVWIYDGRKSVKRQLRPLFFLKRSIPAGWYNFLVPTPFYHLSLAEDLICHPELPIQASKFLRSQRCVFLFGCTAPDVQVVAGLTRRQTHFFDLPIQSDDPQPWQLLFDRYPQLADAKRLSERHRAFLAGYLCHLQADWMWVKEIFAPVFGPGYKWGRFEERLYLHNILRAYLDVRILAHLNPGMEDCVDQVEPNGWLPFVGKQELTSWRDLVFNQLKPGAAIQTVEVFSSRQGRSVREFEALLNSEERMQGEVFTRIPLSEVQSYHQRILDENVQLLNSYLVFLIEEEASQYIEHKIQGA